MLHPRFQRFFSPALSCALALVGACGPTAEVCDAPDIVLGVKADPTVAAQARQVQLVAYDQSGEIARASKDISSGALFPFEFPFRPHAGQGFRVTTEVFYDATRGGAVLGPGGVSLLASREVNLAAMCTKSKELLRVDLQERCISVFCKQNETCISGVCVNSTLSADALEPYNASWAAEPDACAPAGSGSPEVTLGTGQTDYVATAPDSTVQAEAGPQGGHHIWIGVRTKALHQRAVTVTLNGVVEGTTTEAPMQRTVFSLRTDEGGYCKLFGLRYQLDGGTAPISAFLGKPLRLTVELRDGAGLVAKDELRIMIAGALSGP